MGQRQLAGEGLDWRATRRALAVLAVARRPVTRHELADVVWEGTPPATWETALRGSISAVRKAVAQGGGASPIRTATGAYELSPEVVVDVVRAAEQVSEAEHATVGGDLLAAVDLAGAAAAVLTEAFVAGEDGEWFDRQRRTYDALARRALLLESAAATAVGRHDRAVAAAEAVVALDPYVEAGHQRLMAAHEAAGQRAEAVLAYRRCRDLLREELGVEPSEATELAHRSLVRVAPVAPAPVAAAPAGMPEALAHVLAEGPRLSGRDEELAVLGAQLGGSRPDRSQLVLLVGSAGIGKSRLAAEVAADAQRRGARVLHGRFDAARLSPFDGLAAPLAQAGIVWPPPRVDLTAADHAPLALADAAVAALTELAGEHHLVLVLDDLHWADRSALAVLGAVLEAVPGLTVVATRRTDVHNPALDDLLVDLGAPAEVHVVEALDHTGLAALVSSWAGERPGADLVGWLHRRSGGNPLFAIRLLHGIGAGIGGEGARADVRMLPEVPTAEADEAGADRLDVLAGAWEAIGPDGRSMVSLAAVAGLEVQAELLAEASGLPTSTVLARLDRGVRTGLLGQSPADPGRFHVVHQLVRDAVLATLEPHELAERHRRIALVLASRPSAEPAEVIRHLLDARDVDLLLAAVVPAARSARQLATHGAPELALALLDEVADRLDADAPEASAALGRIEVAAVTAELTRNNVAQARARLRRALELADRSGDPRVLLGLAGALRTPEGPGVDDEVLRLLERVLATTDADTPERAVVLMLWSYELGRSAEVPRSVVLAAEAVEIGRRLLDSELLRAALHAWHDASRPIVHPSERATAMEEAIALEGRFPSRHLDGVSWFHLANDRIELGDGGGAHEALARCGEAMASGATVAMRWLHVRVLGVLAMAEGRWADAEAHLQASEAIAVSLGSPEAVLLTFSQRMTLNQFRGDRTPYRDLLASVVGPAEAEPILVCGSAFADAELGHPDAVRSADRAVSVALSMAPVLTSWPSLVLASIAAAHVGHPAAPELSERLRPRSGCHVLIQSAAYLGPVDWVLGRLAVASGDLDAGIDLLAAAADQCRALGAGPFLARVLVDRSRALEERGADGDPVRAEEASREAAALVEELDLEHVGA